MKAKELKPEGPTPRELVIQAIAYRSPPRPPLFFRTDPDRSDIVQVAYHSPTNFVDSEKTRDELGCLWGNAIGTGTGYILEHPLDDWGNLSAYTFPDPRQASRFTAIEDAVQRYPNKFVVASLGLTGFGILAALRGFENVLTDLYLEPDLLARLADLVFDFETAAIEEIGRRSVDAVWFFDDWGMEQSLFIRPDLWRSVFKPRYAAQFHLIHELGMRAFFHSCGCVWQIIPDLIEIGVDVLNLEQMGLFRDETRTGYERIAQEFGGRVCFTVNVDSQRTLTSGTPQQIEQEVRHIFRTFGNLGGGFIVFADAGKDHYIHPSENLRLIEELCVSITLH
jgi:uroporphyrinogen-III decarboxylase